MAVIKPGPTISRIAGAQGSHVFSCWKGRSYVRSKAINRSNPCSSRQSIVRAASTIRSKMWNDYLTEEQRILWEQFAQRNPTPFDPASSSEQGSRVVIPQPKPVLTGYDCFVRHNVRAVETGITPLDVPIVTPNPTFPNPVTGLERVVTPPIPQNFALDFDGVNECVRCADVLDYEYNQPFSWELWMNLNATPTQAVMISKWDRAVNVGYYLFWRPYDLVIQLRDGVAGGNLSRLRLYNYVGTWHHIVVTYDGSNSRGGLRFYVDSVPGEYSGGLAPIVGSLLNTEDLIFASFPSAPLLTFPGQMDAIRNYNRVVTPAEVVALFNGGAGVFGPDPFGDGNCQGSWPFCAGGGNTLFDISGNNYHGTLQNMEPGDWVPGRVPCPDIPGVDQIQWTPPTVPTGSKIRIWIQSYDAHVHRQHVATVDIGVGFWVPTTVRVANGAEVPIANMPGHYLVQADIIDPNGNQSPPSNTIEITIP